MKPKRAPIREREHFTTGEVAKWMGVSISAVTKWILSGQVHATAPAVEGGRRYVKRDSVIELLKRYNVAVPGLRPERPLILFLDDEPKVCRIVVHAFESRSVPIDVRTATSVEEGLRLIDEGLHPTLIVLDWHFKGAALQKEEAVEAFARHGQARSIPILMVSGTEPVRAAEVAVERRLAGFVKKPFALEDLKDTVWRLVFGEDRRRRPETEQRRPMRDEIKPKSP